MRVIALGLAVALVALSGCLAHAPDYAQLLEAAQVDHASAFREFAQLHGKAYLGDAAEYARRHEAFQANLAKIVAHNSRSGVSYKLGLNAHADLTTEEFRLRYFGARPVDILELRRGANEKGQGEEEKGEGEEGDDKRPKGEKFPYSHEVPPARRDWREEGKITPVKDQHVGGAPCGCCYAFGGMAGVEAANTLYTGQLTTLSEQEIVDCDGLDYGCDGGDFANVFKWVRDNGGVDTDAHWPYEAKVTTCHKKRMRKHRPVTINGFVDVPEHNETALMQSVSHTPTVVAVCCGDYLDQWHLYKSGIMGQSVQCTKPLDHSVLVVGYDSDPESGEQFWLVKNSWGAQWGEGGYMRLKRGVAERDGQAGLATFPGYAYKNTPNPGHMRRMDMRGSMSTLVEYWQQWAEWLGTA